MLVAPGFSQAQCLSSGPLPGVVQTVHRAEIMALIAALRYAVWAAKAPRIWIDNQLVQRKAQSICEHLWAPTPNSRDSDLWQVVAALVGQCVQPVRACKVVSHCQPSDDLGPVETWARIHNATVDQLAASANQQWPEHVLNAVKQVQDNLQALRTLASEIQTVQMRVGIRATQTVKEAKRQGNGVPPELPPARACPQPVLRGGGGECPKSAAKFGIDFVRHVKAWVSLTWCEHMEARWRSFAQLLIDFQMGTGRPGPLYDSVQWRWVDCMKVKSIHHVRASAGDRTRWFRIALLEILKELLLDVHASSVRPYSTALWATLPCIAWRWKQERWEVVEGWLRQQLPQGAVRGEYRALRNVPVAALHNAMGPVVVQRAGVSLVFGRMEVGSCCILLTLGAVDKAEKREKRLVKYLVLPSQCFLGFAFVCQGSGNNCACQWEIHIDQKVCPSVEIFGQAGGRRATKRTRKVSTCFCCLLSFHLLNVVCCSLLILKGIYHYWTHCSFFFFFLIMGQANGSVLWQPLSNHGS